MSEALAMQGQGKGRYCSDVAGNFEASHWL